MGNEAIRKVISMEEGLAGLRVKLPEVPRTARVGLKQEPPCKEARKEGKWAAGSRHQKWDISPTASLDEQPKIPSPKYLTLSKSPEASNMLFPLEDKSDS